MGVSWILGCLDKSEGPVFMRRVEPLDRRDHTAVVYLAVEENLLPQLCCEVAHVSFYPGQARARLRFHDLANIKLEFEVLAAKGAT